MFASTIQIFILLTPFFVLSVFVSMTEQKTLGQRRRIAVQTPTAIAVGAVVVFFLGNHILRFLGITLDAFRIGAGLVLLLGGLDLVRGGARNGTQAEASSDEAIAIVPLAIPCAIGPGTIGALLVMGNNAGNDIRQILDCVFGIALSSAGIGVILYFADWIGKVVGKKGLVVLSRLTGLFLAALAAQIIAQGVRNFFRG
ncbi:MAG: MarC family protein [Victivallaceae bacterium]|nr:MarC family protein [Victivallaceae bacterium]